MDYIVPFGELNTKQLLTVTVKYLKITQIIQKNEKCIMRSTKHAVQSIIYILRITSLLNSIITVPSAMEDTLIKIKHVIKFRCEMYCSCSINFFKLQLSIILYFIFIFYKKFTSMIAELFVLAPDILDLTYQTTIF